MDKDSFLQSADFRKELEAEAATRIQQYVRQQVLVTTTAADPCSDDSIRSGLGSDSNEWPGSTCAMCEQPECQCGESDLSLEGSDSADWEVVWLPRQEWRNATGLLNLSLESIDQYYRGDQQGVQNYDDGRWYKIRNDLEGDAPQPSTPPPVPIATAAACQPLGESDTARSLAARTESTLQQIAQAEYLGFTEQLVRRAISIVGPDDALGIARWLMESGERPNREIAEKCLTLLDD